MLNFFGQSVSYYQILVFIMLIGAGIYVSLQNRKNNQEKNEFNEAVARDLGWNVYFTKPINFLYNYIFAQSWSRFLSQLIWFEGDFNSLHIKLISLYTGSHRGFMSLRPWFYILAVEFSGIKNKNYDFAIVSWLANGSAYSRYQRVEVPDDQFNQKFAVYSLQSAGSFNGLSAGTIAKLLNFKETYFDKSLIIEVRENATFIVGNYKPFGNYMVSQVNDVKAKEQILTDFLSNCTEILNLFKH